MNLLLAEKMAEVVLLKVLRIRSQHPPYDGPVNLSSQVCKAVAESSCCFKSEYWPHRPPYTDSWSGDQVFQPNQESDRLEKSLYNVFLKKEKIYTICPFMLFSVNGEMKQWQEISWSYLFLYSGKLGGQVRVTLYRWRCILVQIMAHGELEAVQEVDNIPEKVTVYHGKNHGPWRAWGCAGSLQYSWSSWN